MPDAILHVVLLVLAGKLLIQVVMLYVQELVKHPRIALYHAPHAHRRVRGLLVQLQFHVVTVLQHVLEVTI